MRRPALAWDDRPEVVDLRDGVPPRALRRRAEPAPAAPAGVRGPARGSTAERRRRAATGAAVKPKVDFRPDVEGLRAVAVVLVVVFHAGVAQLGGGFVGVDVFFVISGFLITGLVVDEVLRTGTISLGSFYARRARRLLPAASVVLVATTVAFSLILPAIDRPALAADVYAAAFWFANWHFAAGETDYFAGLAQSPLLHYWSLSVEEQFYLVWPLLVLAVAGRTVAKAHRGPRAPGRQSTATMAALPSPRVVVRRVAVALLPLGALSLAVSALTTGSSGPWAYFGVHTRAWELAAGGAVALSRGYLHRLSTGGAAVLGWSGLTLIVSSALLLDEATPFPGTAALLPVAGAAAVLAAGGRTQAGVASLLGREALTYVGRISYSWYLWHWPCLEFARRLTAEPVLDDFAAPDADPWALVLALLVSFALATLTHRLVEQPLRSWRFLAVSRPRTLAFSLALVAVVAAAPIVTLGQDDQTLARAGASTAVLDGDDSTPASAPHDIAKERRRGVDLVVAPPRKDAGAPPAAPTMTPQQARRDDVLADDPCYARFEGTQAPAGCVFGDPAGTRDVVLVGDSHAANWFPALDAAAKSRKWRLHFWAKSACGYADVTQWLAPYRRTYTECAQWRASVLRHVAALPRVDAVLVGRSVSYLGQMVGPDGNLLDRRAAAPVWDAGAARTVRTLLEKTRRVVLLRDVPRSDEDVPTCLSANTGSPDACAFPRARGAYADAEVYAAEGTAAATEGVTVLDPTALVCPGAVCPVISPDGAVMYRDLHHFTATYSRELAADVGRAVAPLLTRR